MPNHRKSIRLENYDYAASGTYFITLVTWNRKLLFGEITKGDIHLNPFGEIVQQQWLMSEKIRKEIILDEFIIMPNHFHAIVVIRELSKFSNLGDQPVAPTEQHLSTGPTSKSLGALVAGFKSACTTKINTLRQSPGVPLWQRNYFERIIRNQREIEATREYIRNNPLNWKLDSENYRSQQP